MAINVVLQTENGRILRQVIDTSRGLNWILPIDNPDFPLLQFVDPYGDTIFNERQTRRLVEELKAVIETAEKPEEKALLKQVKDLAEEIDTHLYVRFIGD
ncbi:MAG TPA: hypothetical protein VJW94_11580 [Candidatus Acidoferrum sp.]|nr:hypothetical protein [Candidatus Acidoferrum sp.]